MTSISIPALMAAPASVAELDDLLSQPSPQVLEVFANLPGDIVFLGVGGKMGPTMARMAKRASELTGTSRRVIGVSRFSSPAARQSLEKWGIETIACDVLNEAEVQNLPDVPNVVSMTGFKFGSSSNPTLTWAMNCYVPALVCKKYRNSRIVTFSTGNVYGMVPIQSGGSRETDTLYPIGEYAITAMGRERMYDYFSREFQIPMAILRLNYATELRYGVLVDIATEIFAERPVDISMGYVNVIWQTDANAMSLAAFSQLSSPAKVVNVAGPEILRIRDVCEKFGGLFGKPVKYAGVEGESALLNNGRIGHQLLGAPRVTIDQIMHWTAEWIARGGESLGKPTHFQSRDGKF